MRPANNDAVKISNTVRAAYDQLRQQLVEDFQPGNAADAVALRNQFSRIIMLGNVSSPSLLPSTVMAFLTTIISTLKAVIPITKERGKMEATEAMENIIALFWALFSLLSVAITLQLFSRVTGEGVLAHNDVYSAAIRGYQDNIRELLLFIESHPRPQHGEADVLSAADRENYFRYLTRLPNPDFEVMASERVTHAHFFASDRTDITPLMNTIIQAARDDLRIMRAVQQEHENIREDRGLNAAGGQQVAAHAPAGPLRQRHAPGGERPGAGAANDHPPHRPR